jgi:hypothetical protein
MSPNYQKNYPKLEEEKKKKNLFKFFLGVIDPLKRFLHLKMLNYAPK